MMMIYLLLDLLATRKENDSYFKWRHLFLKANIPHQKKKKKKQPFLINKLFEIMWDTNKSRNEWWNKC